MVVLRGVMGALEVLVPGLVEQFTSMAMMNSAMQKPRV
jgi:hypothetical protein